MYIYSAREILKQLISYDSVTPKGLDCLQYIAEMLTALNFSTEIITINDTHNLFAIKHGEAPHICFVGHVDVVPPGEGWQSNPFVAMEKSGRIYGRGAVDMKGAIACFLEALEQTKPAFTVSVLLTTDEEGSAKNGVKAMIPWLMQNNITPDFALVGEPTARKNVGDVIKNGRRGSMTAYISAKGVQGHVAYPDLASSAATAMIELLQSLRAAPLDNGNQFFDPSNLEIIQVDIPNSVNNVIPGLANARVNVRYNTEHTASSLEMLFLTAGQKVEIQHTGIIFEFTFEHSAHPFLSKGGNTWSSFVQRSVENVTGKKTIINTEGGTSDARFIQKLCPVIELGLCNSMAHKVDEYVTLKDLEKLTKIYSHLLAQMPQLAL